MKALVAGVGNVFFRDDGFGVEVVRRLLRDPLPPGVEVEDFGIRGLHLAYRLLEGASLLVIVDVVRLGGAPGTLYVVEPDAAGHRAPTDPHAFDVAAVLGAVRRMGGTLPPVRIVGCEPEVIAPGMGLSAAVAAAVEAAAEMVREELRPGARAPELAVASPAGRGRSPSTEER